jgi:PKD repeat protein
MKTIKKLFTLLFVFTAFVSCKEDFLEETDFGIVAPSNVSATFNITQDNTGLVTITPTAVGAVSFDVDFGDGSEVATAIAAGKHAKHTFTEGNHTVGITANGLGGLKTAASVDLVVSFKAPQNLVVAITNSETISKQIDVVATADYATTFDVNPGVDGVEAVSANIGDTATYIYDEAGTYTITVTAKGGAIETTSFSQDFEVTAIQQPVISADTPPSRKITDVVSVFSSVYDDLTGTDFFPNWGQSTTYTEYDLEGDKMIQYANLNYQGVQFETQNVSNMQYLHMDVWTCRFSCFANFSN